MAKTKRGRVLWSLPSRGRGTCPVCSSTRIKLLYTQTKTDGTSLKVCKKCFKAVQSRVDKAHV
ncbi:hypothetical protein MHI48_26505 [Paenibacillus sp. FSL H7-0942]|uniref:50S ribosomal protein L28 n=1 Tax=Paenibacillus amylolyticus TaxID=1451 RepID=A0ABD8AQM0_PAEAM|nr:MULTISPECIES: hypothetical protein [Paenibacillus]UOK63071.1 hypothetical protein MT997_34260 [Paenibacillus sp. OVF10]APO47795.1 hypothetical protein BS614_29755 [Paenibacillus xylanexedens]ETT54379.1 hypothetical protein C170_04613 [Paenibacillus sp. FSL H7-689]MBD8841271.1 hypothetical protein [Paenibacillus sp. CFBP 13594]MCL6663319.1 hypothetical protein [Paenibacillus amylolyticus]